MKKLISLFFIICLSGRLYAQFTDHDKEIMSINGKWARHPDVNQRNDSLSTRNQSALAIKKIDSIAYLLKQTCPDPAGIEAAWYASVNEKPLFKGAPASYSLSSLYKSYYFNSKINKIALGNETGTWIYAYVNDFGRFLVDQGEWMIDGRPTKVYNLLETEGEWKGLPLYKTEYWGVSTSMGRYKDRAVLITRDGKLPYIPVTQKEYLLAVKDKWLKLKQKTPNEYYDKKIKTIEQYLSTRSEMEMRQPVATTSVEDFIGHFGPNGKQTVYNLVRIDPSYFESHLPRHVPQFIVLYWRCDKNTAAIEFIKQFETNFPVSKLKALLNETKEEVKEDVVQKFDPVNDPELKAIRIKAEKYADSIWKTKKQIPDLSKYISRDTGFNYTIPSRNEKLLGAVPGKKLTPAELKAWLEPIDKKYTEILLTSGIQLPKIDSLSTGAISNLSILALLNGMSLQAAWLAIKAAERTPDSVLILNNAGAVLSGCGFQPVAIPILESALEKSSVNSTLQNNLGQAYLALGDKFKATSYLHRTVSNSPYQPHANFSLACIYNAGGDKASALKYVEKSIRGSFTDGAWNLLLKLKHDARLMDYLKDHYKPTDYFNENKYHPLEQCETISGIAAKKAEYKGYHDMLSRVEKEFAGIDEEQDELGKEAMIDKIKNYKTSGIHSASFTGLGAAMMYDVDRSFQEKGEELERARNIYEKEINELYNGYYLSISDVDNCKERLALADLYMKKMAVVTREYQRVWLPAIKDYFNDRAYWGVIASPDKHLQRAVYAAAVTNYLGELRKLAETHFLEPCEPGPEYTKDQEDYLMPEYDCLVDVGMEFGIGSFSLDCEKMEYHFGGLLVADAVHTFKDHRTTIAIGAGLDLKFGGQKLKAGPIQGGFGATGKMQYFLTFDGTRPSDQGFIWEGAIKYKQKILTGNDEIGDIETTNVNLSAKTVLSVHNGFTSKGSLYDQLDKILEVKPQKQANKNIKPYNPQK